jgi:hypothetical protein
MVTPVADACLRSLGSIDEGQTHGDCMHMLNSSQADMECSTAQPPEYGSAAQWNLRALVINHCCTGAAVLSRL